MITKLRCNNIKLPIETGRWSNTLREERICHLCNVGLGTEFHFLFECTSADVQRLRCKSGADPEGGAPGARPP